MSKIFVPRTVPPQIGEKWYSTQYNACLAISNGTVLPNCVGYAYGRFAEILGYFHPDLPKGNAGIWLDELKKTNTSLKWGTIPKLGAVAVWKEPGAYGHVGIVEYIYDDGTIMLSESGYGSGWNKRFWNSGPRTSPNWYGAPYVFQGFIYNPGTEDVTNVAPYTGGIKYGTDLSSFFTKYEDQVAAFQKSVLANSSSGSKPPSTQSYATPSQSLSTTDPIKKFINVISAHSGQNNDGFEWVKTKTGFSYSGWSAAMLCAASIETSQSDIIPTSTFSYGAFASELVKSMNGKYIAGSKQNGVENPKVGDIFAIGVTTSKAPYAASTMGVVTEVQGSSIQVLEGDCGKKILSKTRRLADVSYYIRPNWTRTSFTQQELEPAETGPTYDFQSVVTTRTEVDPIKGPPQVDYLDNQSRNDATLREVSYLTEQVKPSITTTGTKLSAINYSGMLGKVYDTMGLSNVQHPDSSNIDSYNFNGTYFQSSATNMQGVPQIIFEFLHNKGLVASVIIGFLANIQAESSFKTNAVNSSSGASGICQWTGKRKDAMIKYCGSDWRNNLTGQLEFMWNELQSTEQKTMTLLSAIQGQTQSAAEQATEIICREYARPKNVEEAVKLRKGLTQTLWNQLSATYTTGLISSETSRSYASSSYVPSDVVTNSSGVVHEKGSIVEIPSWLPVNKISTSFINFKKQSTRWTPNTNLYFLNERWEKQNRPSKYYVCCVDNYLIVDTSIKLGESGDIISIVFDNGSYLNAIIAQSIGLGFYVEDNQKDIIRWMAAGDDVASLQVGLNQAGCLGRSIVKVINYGTWFA